jgi:hypothetical protein
MTDFMDVLDTILVADETQLNQIQQAVKQRKEIVMSRVISSLTKGDKVRFNDKIRPKYLVGLEATVEKINQKTVGVKVIDNDKTAARKFGYGVVRCPISLIESI